MASIIQIKRSTTTEAPTNGSLAAGELAFSGLPASNSLFVGDANGNPIRVAGSKYLWLHQANTTQPGALTANAVILTNGNSFITNLKSNALTVGTDGATLSVTNISSFANSTQIGGSAGGSNAELLTSYAIKSYVDSNAPLLTNTHVAFGSNSFSNGGSASFTFDSVNTVLSVGNSTVNTTISATNLTTRSTVLANRYAERFTNTAVNTILVTVASKVANEHIYYGSGSGSGYVLEGIQSPYLTLVVGKTYKFDQAGGTNSSHPLRFYLDAARNTAYTTDVTESGTPGSAGAYTQIVVTENTPSILHYGCGNHGYMGNQIQVSGSPTFATANVLGVTVLGGTLGVTGAATLSDTLGVTKAATFSNTIAVTGNATFSDVMTVTGAATFSNTIAVTSNATFSNTIAVTGAATLSSTLDVTGAANLASTLGVTGAATFSNTVAVTGNAAFSNTMAVTGAANLASTLGVTGAATFSNTIAVTSNATFSNTIAVTGAATFSNTIAVTSNATFSNVMTVTGAATLSNTIAVTGNATFSDVMTVTGAATFSNTIAVTSNATFSNTIAVTGNATFSNNLTVTGSVTNTVNFNASGDVTVGGNLAINGTLTTINTTTLNISDPLIRLANNNLTTDVADVGFFGSFGNNTVTQFTGLFRDQSDSAIYKLFSGAIPEPSSTVNTANINFAFADLQLKTLFAATVNTANAQITGGAITGITDLAVVDGGTGVSVFANNGIVFGSNTLSLSVTAAGTEGQLLTAGAGGVPAFATLDGGSF